MKIRIFHLENVRHKLKVPKKVNVKKENLINVASNTKSDKIMKSLIILCIRVSKDKELS